MSNSELNEKVMACKSDPQAVNSIIEEYKPFIASCASRFTGRYLEYGVDEELSVSLLAFHQAVMSFDISRGSFLKFAKTVIFARLADYARKQKAEGRMSYLSDLYIDKEGETVESDLMVDRAVNDYYESQAGLVRRLEIEELKDELGRYGIRLDELVKESPKSKKTKDLSRKALRYIMNNPELSARIRHKASLPVAEMEAALKVPRKTIERMRKYLIAAVIILCGDYEYIKEYIKLDM